MTTKDTSMDIAVSELQHGNTTSSWDSGRPRQDDAQEEGGTTARNATDEVTQKQRADMEGHVT